MSREYTNEEVREQFLAHVRGIADYWQNRPSISLKEATEGVAFSILVALDGESELPAFEVIASPHPEDKVFSESQGENYYPVVALKHNIAGELHERFFKK